MIDLPSFQTYSQYKSDNYGAHALQFFVGGLTIWFSYTTPVAFKGNGHRRTVRENEWGPTTGKHLNLIDNGDKASRIDGEEFERRLEEATGCQCDGCKAWRAEHRPEGVTA